MTADLHAFQVDLRGVVDLFSRHLYSGPRVYVRELLQNAVDAITARRLLDPDAPARVRIDSPQDRILRVVDTGIGLTAAEAADVLATIGRSSKRDVELGVGRSEFLGQFGIGLLSAFMVADEVEVLSRSARDPKARAIRWRGYDDGRYELTELDEELEPGTTLRLHVRRDAAHWIATDTVVGLAQEYGGLLPVDVAVEVTTRSGEQLWRRTTRTDLPWSGDDEQITEYCKTELGFDPLTQLRLSVPLAGLTGVAYVLPSAPAPGPGTNQVYLKRMLLGQRVEGLLPDWAFFVRCVIDADGLRPTASREALYEDEVLLAVRDALAAQIKTWVIDVVSGAHSVGRAFLETHHLALRAMARNDDDMLDLVSQVLPFETTDGARTLAQVQEEHGQILFTLTVEEFRRVAPVARAQGLAVVNAGYVYDGELLERLASRRPQWQIRAMRTDDLAAVLAELDLDEAMQVEDVRREAQALLAPYECEVAIRRFEPDSLPSMLLTDRDAMHQASLEKVRSQSDDVWGDILGDVAVPAGMPRQLVLNFSNPAVTSVLAAKPDLREPGVHALYVSAVLLSGEPVRASESALLTEALARLLSRD